MYSATWRKLRWFLADTIWISQNMQNSARTIALARIYTTRNHWWGHSRRLVVGKRPFPPQGHPDLSSPRSCQETTYLHVYWPSRLTNSCAQSICRKPPSQASSGYYHACSGCGGKPHPGSRPRCPTFSLSCNICGKVGHFAKMCHSKPTHQDGVPPSVGANVLSLLSTIHHVATTDPASKITVTSSSLKWPKWACLQSLTYHHTHYPKSSQWYRNESCEKTPYTPQTWWQKIQRTYTSIPTCVGFWSQLAKILGYYQNAILTHQ